MPEDRSVGTPTARVSLTLGALAVGIVALAARTLPLWRSPLPFNPDGLVYAGLVRETLSTGRFPLGAMAVDQVQFTALLAAVARLSGAPARLVAQPLAAVLGALSVVLAVAVAWRLAAGWAPRRRRAAALAAGAVLAVDGVYLHRSMAVDEQTLGLLFVPLAVLVLARARTTGDRRWYLALAPPLVAVPPTHNLESVVLALALACWTAVAWRRSGAADSGGAVRGPRSDPSPDPPIAPLAAVTVAFIAYVGAYFLVLERVTPLTLVQSDRIAQVPGLVLAWLVLVGIGLPWLLGRSPGRVRAGVLATLAAFFGVVAVNAVAPLFPAMPATSRTVLLLVAPLALVAAAGAWGVAPALHGELGRGLVALLGGVTVLVGVSLTATLTPEYLATLYRVQTFLHLPIAALAGVGVVALVDGFGWRSGRITGRLDDEDTRRVALAALTAVLVLAAAASVPVALGGLEVLSYKGTTTPAELSAAGHAATHVPTQWTSDDHVVRITGYHAAGGASGAAARLATGRRGPALSYLSGGPAPRCATVVQHSWTTVGGQAFPRSPAVLPRDRYRSLLRERAVVYAASDPATAGSPLPRDGSPADPLHLVLPGGRAPPC